MKALKLFHSEVNVFMISNADEVFSCEDILLLREVEVVVVVAVACVRSLREVGEARL